MPSINKIIGEPLGPQLNWPCDRSLKMVKSLHEFNDKHTLFSRLPNSASFDTQIEKGEIVVDFGCGYGRALSKLKTDHPAITTIGVTAHKALRVLLKNIDKCYYVNIPKDQRLLEDFINS